MLRLVALSLLLLLLPLAGCVDPDASGETPAAAADPASPASASPGTPAAAPAGKATPHEEPAANATPDAPPQEVTTPLAWDGSLGAGVCAPAGPGACFGGTFTKQSRVLPIEAPGAPARFAATVTWTASSPLTNELFVVLARTKSCGDGCFEGQNLGTPASGPSPLTLEVGDLPALAEDEFLAVFVSQGRLTPEPVYAYARAPQDFHLEGSVVSMA